MSTWKEYLTEAKTKLTKLSDNKRYDAQDYSSKIGKSDMENGTTTIVSDDVFKFIFNKFDAKKWQSAPNIQNALKKKNKPMKFYSKKKADLGTDELEVSVIKDKYVITRFTPSNSNKSVFTTYEIK
jgi:hypothetical protein